MSEPQENVAPEEHPAQGDAEGPEAGDGLQKVEPGTGGYQDRDPKTEMPRVPGQPETQDKDD